MAERKAACAFHGLCSSSDASDEHLRVTFNSGCCSCDCGILCAGRTHRFNNVEEVQEMGKSLTDAAIHHDGKIVLQVIESLAVRYDYKHNLAS